MKDEGRSERGPSMLSLRANQHSRMSVAKSLLGMTALIAVWATAATGVQSPSALAQQPCSVTLEGFEVTQAIQTFHKGESSPPALDNAVRLVAGRATTVRVYLDSGDACIVQGVGGTLEYSTALAGARQIQVADNGTITVNGGETNKQRRSASPETDGQAYKTLNYTFTAPVD